MTYQDLEQLVSDLQSQVSDLSNQISDSNSQMSALTDQVSTLTDLLNGFSDVANLSLDLQNALQQRGFMRSNTPLDDINPATGTTTVYVATISGGTIDHPITFKDGILITP